MNGAYYKQPNFNNSAEMFERMHDVQRIINKLNSLRDRGLTAELRNKIFKHIKTSHIYNSNAIEGNILSLRETQVILDNMELNDRPLKDQIEARSLNSALDLLQDLINGREHINKHNILNLHGILMKDIYNVTEGSFRHRNVSISGACHTPPNWEDIDDHINDLLRYYEENKTAPIILKAAVIHHWFVWIHPFEDGNGRIGRLLLNFFLLQNGFPELIVRVEDRDQYYSALMNADKGDITNLVDLFTDKLFETASIYNEFINEEARHAEWTQRFSEKGSAAKIQTESYNYEVWKSAIEVFKTRFTQAANSIDSALPIIDISLKEYPILSLNGYLDLLDNRAVSNTWFFSVRFKQASKEDITCVFYFERWFPPTFNNRPQHNSRPQIKLFYSLRRSGHNLRQQTDIDLVNVGVKNDKLVIGERRKDDRRKVQSIEAIPGPSIRKFIEQILAIYFEIK